MLASISSRIRHFLDRRRPRQQRLPIAPRRRRARLAVNHRPQKTLRREAWSVPSRATVATALVGAGAQAVTRPSAASMAAWDLAVRPTRAKSPTTARSPFSPNARPATRESTDLAHSASELAEVEKRRIDVPSRKRPAATATVSSATAMASTAPPSARFSGAQSVRPPAGAVEGGQRRPARAVDAIEGSTGIDHSIRNHQCTDVRSWIGDLFVARIVRRRVRIPIGLNSWVPREQLARCDRQVQRDAYAVIRQGRRRTLRHRSSSPSLASAWMPGPRLFRS